MRLKEMFRQLNSKLRGYFNCYGVVGNLRSICRFHHQAMEVLHKKQNGIQGLNFTIYLIN